MPSNGPRLPDCTLPNSMSPTWSRSRRAITAVSWGRFISGFMTCSADMMSRGFYHEDTLSEDAALESQIDVINVGRRDPKTEGWLIRDVSFAVNPGDRLGIVGPSGAGKTVLLRALA